LAAKLLDIIIDWERKNETISGVHGTLKWETYKSQATTPPTHAKLLLAKL